MRSSASLALAALAGLVALVGVALSLPPSSALAAEPDPGRVALGKTTFRTYCASCHGTEARGDGPVAEALTPPPTDLTTLAARNGGVYPADEVFAVIDGREVKAHGRRDMPVWGNAFRIASGRDDENEVRERITDLVHFIGSIQVSEGEDDAVGDGSDDG